MTLLDTFLRYLKIKKDRREIEIVTYDLLNDNNYFESFYPLILENEFRGTIVCSGDIHIKKNASFTGELICRTCKIEGNFKGSLLSTEHTAVCNTAHLDAKIVAGSILIKNDAVVTGNFKITREILNPEPLRKLETDYSKLIHRGDDERREETAIERTILLRGQPMQTNPAKPPAPPAISQPVFESEGAALSPLNETRETEINRPNEAVIPTQNGGWW